MSTTANNEKLLPSDSSVCGKSRSNRLARRARSFKEDFLEIISQMRSSGNAGTRSGSPCSPKGRTKTADIIDGSTEKNPSKDLECNIRQAQLALKHFRDVINKNKLEMLPGNGTIVLETVTAIHVLLKKYVLNEQSSILVSATNQVYQSLAKLIKLCDDYLLIGEKALGKENVTEIVNIVEDAINNLVSLTRDKISVRDSSCKLVIEPSTQNKPRPLPEDLGQRNSLPDIPLTPREREILERTSAFVLERHSQSTENVLSDSPPPKPPHPDRVHLESSFPPPLPPKKRQKNSKDLTTLKNSMECLSMRSRSPEDSSSLLSASGGSLDSVLNHCREEIDGANILDTQCNRENNFQSNITERGGLVNGGSSIFSWDNSSALDRMSESQGESGFVSLTSGRSSFQSYTASSHLLNSARSSQQSSTSQESHYNSKKIVSTESTSIKKFQTSAFENTFNQGAPPETVTFTSSEKHSYKKQSFTKISSTVSTESESNWMENFSASKEFEEIPCCHHEVKLFECPLHATSFESDQSTAFYSSSHENLYSSDNVKPPALPEKIKPRSFQGRHPSQYDNVADVDCIMETSHSNSSSSFYSVTKNEFIEHKEKGFSTSGSILINNDKGIPNSFENMVAESKAFESISQETNLSISTLLKNSTSPDGKPPPLPPKKKHMFQSVAYSVMAYMEIFGNASHANANEFLRHSVHAYNLLQSEWQQQHQSLLTSTQSCSFTISNSNQSTPIRIVDSKCNSSSLPPALPPKKRTRSNTSSPPQTPLLQLENNVVNRNEFSDFRDNCKEINRQDSSTPETLSVCPTLSIPSSKIDTSAEGKKENEAFLLDRLNVSDHLIIKSKEDEGPDIRGGHPDALIVHATKAHKNDFLYQEAFLTTYRTFMTPLELIQKLCYRHERFSNSQESLKQRAARESFSLLVRVVSDLTLTDLEQVVLQTLMEFVQQLLCRGDLTMAKALRVIMLNKYDAKKLYLNANCLLPSHNIYTRQQLLLDFKSEQVAEQMTLLDAELFLKIEIPEVLIWAQEQNEERSPNLTKFTEHFNKMSYWARSRILEQNDAKDREKYVIKFIKIMKHLRKINNFNSYLALLSALDSAPVRRLEWQKHITEGLKEYCTLIDSSSSFRAYRQALAETHPPCIPYIGLVLQDLTFVHIGNTNNLPCGGINFSKRWQQFNIVENMKRFKKGSYPYKKNERIIAFFNGFDDSLSEEAMWQISEKIKPRGGRKP